MGFLRGRTLKRGSKETESPWREPNRFLLGGHGNPLLFQKKRVPADTENMLNIKAAIEELGLLPLFRSRAAGWSVEEMFPQARWWTGTQDDPWQLRVALSADPDVVYAKLFDGKAGFVHRRFYADLLNLRRDGYDFDTLVDEGRVPLKERKLMQAAEEAGEAAFSHMLKRSAGFQKGGLSGFDAVSASLQQKCYLLVSGFGRKRDKFGREYGWEIGILDTPERRFGPEFIENAYSIEPEESFERLAAHLHRVLPGADREAVEAIVRGER